MTAANSRLLKRLVPVFIFYYLAFPAVDWTFRHHNPHGPLAYVLAIVRALPVLALFVLVGMFFAEEKDEFKRFLITQALLWGVGLTFALSTVWGFLELFTHAPHLNILMLLPIFCLVAVMAKFALRRRYR